MANPQANGGMIRVISGYVLVHLGLILLFFLPGGLIWNRLDPWILGWPFSAFATALLLPLLIFINVLALVRKCWRHDLALMAQLQAGRSIVEAEIRALESDEPGVAPTGPDASDTGASAARQ